MSDVISIRARPPKPITLPFDGLPSLSALDALRSSPRWVGWDHTFVDERGCWSKVPRNPRTGGKASATNPATWSTYEQAEQFARREGLAGVGFVVTGEDGVIGIDLDKCVDPTTGAREPWVEEVLVLAETYAEVSPSGTGIRILARDGIDRTVKYDPARVEIYKDGRYLAITGRHVEGTPTEIRPAPRTLALLLARVEAIRAEVEAAKQAQRPRGSANDAGETRPGKIVSTFGGGHFFRAVNGLALERLSAWVPAMFGSVARFQPGTHGYRITSRSLGRGLEEDLSITSQGIKDWGVHAMGDAREGRRTAVDLVLEYGGLPGPSEAALWLCDHLGVDPASLGWRANGTNGTNGTELRDIPEQANTADWDKPDLSLLGTGRRPAPPFPLQLLKPFWARWVERRAAAASAPVDYVGVSLLACAGAMLANVRWPVAGAGWAEPPLLWCGLVGHPGAAKSPGMDQAFTVLNLAQERLAIGFDDALRRHETEKQAARATREAWESAVKEAIRAGQQPPCMPEGAETPAAPMRPRVRVADATVEALASLAAGLPRGLLLVRDELSGWFGGFDRYGAGGSDRAFAIEMYGGRSYVVDRVKNAEPRHIRHLSIGVLGGVQPDKLPAIIEGPHDGLSSRLLWAWPEALPDFTLAREHVDDREARTAFARLAELAMGTDESGQPEPLRLRLTSEAENLIEEFARDMARRAEETSGVFASALAKARGHALRLATVDLLRESGELFP